MQHGDTWAPVAGQVARDHVTTLVDFTEPTLDGCVRAIADAARDGVVVAYSMGGRIALHAALRHPGVLRAMVLIGATAGIEDPALRHSRRAADESLAAWMETARIGQIVDFWEAQPVFATQSGSLVADQRPGRLSFDPGFLAGLLRATGQGALDPVWDHLPVLRMPVLAIAGEHDEKYAEVAGRMAARLPQGEVATIADAGHAPQLERPDAVAALIRPWIDGVLAR